MQLEKYSVIIDEEHKVYEFLSKGPKGTIRKVIQYQLLGGNLYNLAFGDWNDVEQKFNDMVRSNNQDAEKILVTVASTVIDFMKHYPRSVIFVQGIIKGNLEAFQSFRNYEGFIVELRLVV